MTQILKLEPPESEALYAFPASSMQERIWRFVQDRPMSPAFNIAVRFLLEGDLDVARLEQALRLLSERHESLRTSFDSQGELCQVVHAAVPIELPVSDLRHLSPEDREKAVDRLSREHAVQFFDLKQLPLWRSALLRTEDAKYILLLNAHHAIFDGWSVGIFSDEVCQFYCALGANVEPVLRELPIQYGDYTVWEKDPQNESTRSKHAGYWRKQLADMKPTRLAGDEVSATYAEDAADIVSQLLPRPLTDALHELAVCCDTTYFVVVLAAFQTLLWHWQRESDITIGTTVAGRSQVEAEPVIGTFINPLPLRSTISPEMTVSQLLDHIRNTVEGAIAHQEYRYESMLQDRQQSGRLFDIQFICQRCFVRPHQVGNLKLTALPSKSQGALFDMIVFLVERESGWRLSCEFAQKRFLQSTAENLLDSYRKLLEALVANPDRTVADLVRDVPQRTPSLLTAQVAAAVFSGATVDPEEVFVLPALPAQKRFWMLDKIQAGNPSSNIPIQLRLRGRFDPASFSHAIDRMVDRHESLRTTFGEIDGEVCQVVHSMLHCAVSYTDCTTSPPITLDQLLTAEAETHFDLRRGPLFRVAIAQIAEDEYVLALNLHHIIGDGWSAGVLVRELFSLYEAEVNQQPDPLPAPAIQLADFAVWQKEWLQSPPALRLREFWTALLKGRLPALQIPSDRPAKAGRQVKGGIETVRIDGSLLEQVRILVKKLEGTPFQFYLAVFSVLLSRYSKASDILIGCPLAGRNVETEGLIGPISNPLYLRIDLSGNPTFIEVIERIKELTLDAFECNYPFEELAPSLDATATHGRNPLSQFYFYHQVAFVDHQSYAGLDVLPVPAKNLPGHFEWQLATIEREGGKFGEFELHYDANLYDAATIRAFLCHFAELVHQAVADPARSIREIPIICGAGAEAIQTGERIDVLTAALLNPEAVTPEKSKTTRHVVLPGNDIEEKLVTMWQELFRTESISIDDNFFDLGGYSLLLARLVKSMEDAFGRPVTPASIFSAPTIREQARLLAQNAIPSEDFGGRIIPVQPEGSRAPIFVISQSLIFRTLASHLGSDQPFFALRMLDEDAAAIAKNLSMTSIGQYYVRLIKKVRPEGPYSIGGWCVAGTVAYEVAQQLRAGGDEVELVFIIDDWAPGHFKSMPRARYAMARLSYSMHRFVYHFQQITVKSSKDRLEYLRERVRILAITAARVTAAWTGRFGKQSATEELSLAEQIEYAAAKAYKPAKYSGTVLLFKSSEQPSGKFLDPELGWRAILAHMPDIEVLPGDHRQIFMDPGASIMASAIAGVLGIKVVVVSKKRGPRMPRPGRTAIAADSCALPS